MATEPRGNDSPASLAVPGRTARFAGEPQDVTGARVAAEEFLRTLARATPPAAPECWHDIVLIVTELASNAVQYAPGPFVLQLRPTFDGVHVTLHDTNPTAPAPRPFHPDAGGGGIGWHLIHTLCSQVSVVSAAEGKDVHVFLPW
ncbi:ATP-binding protein [Streptomyces phaeoluteigriseus]|uniref:ATP-binding protein n=1 Tax=Streptomyces phaeoluteigriseus TaxID=114686 RepID=A0A1V6MZH8_9ACTN|nr:ATP-binding protein [Streptomyces phaeoluteigriseus]OQD57775.1 ATP-binding protein [Streptomyces phaeoluteigriseus]